MPIDFEGAYVSQGNTLSWMSNNTKKMRPPSVAAAIAAPAPAPVTTADSFPALSSKAVASKQTPPPAKFSYAAAASSLSAPATTLPVKQLREGVSPVSGKEGGGGKGDEEIECWTLTSTREFGAANKVRNTIYQPFTILHYSYFL